MQGFAELVQAYVHPGLAVGHVSPVVKVCWLEGSKNMVPCSPSREPLSTSQPPGTRPGDGPDLGSNMTGHTTHPYVPSWAA